MSKSPKKKDTVNEEELDKKKMRQYALIFISVVGVVFLAIWFGREWWTSETVISVTNITVSGKARTLQFSEKTGRENFGDQMQQVDVGAPHYAYFLELKDAANQSSISRVRFKSPVMNIQETPVVVAVGNVVWIVSTTRSRDRDEQGFILKFSVSDEAIMPLDFTLDEKYSIRELSGSRVYVWDRSGVFEPNHSLYGGVYIDLETEKLVDNRRDIK
jgi:hypothetical protein